MTGTSVRRAAGSLWGVRGRRQRGGGSGRGGRHAQGSPCGARGRHVWRCHAAPRSPAGRGTGRAGVRGAVVARVVVVSVVVVARPVVRHTRPTPRAADCRPAASGTPVSRSSACACSPCGDPQTSGWSLPLRWLLALRSLHTSHTLHTSASIAMVAYIGMVACIAMVASIAMVTYIGMVASSGRVASRPGESVPSIAEGIRPPPSRGRPRPASVLTGRARRPPLLPAAPIVPYNSSYSA